MAMLEDRKIKELREKEILVNVDEESIQPISVDLSIDSVVYWELDEDISEIADPKEQQKIQDSDICITYQTPYELKPHETVFVKTKEGLKMSDNLVGHIVEKNSVIRLGLQVSGPMYQPTHQTAIFLRVTNLSEYIIELHKGFSIAQIIFEKIDSPEIPYAQKSGVHYNDEFVFTPPHNLIKKAVKPEEQFKEQIKSVESKVLSVFTMFMGAFVSALALIVVNFNKMEEKICVPQLIQINITLAVCISVILLSVFKFYFHLSASMNKKIKKKRSVRRFFVDKIFFLRRLFLKFQRPRKEAFIYIAACYRDHERNQKMLEILRKEGLPAFLPENMYLKESQEKQDQLKVFHACYYKLSKCDIVLVLYPYGKSVSAEIGYAIAKDKKIIEYKPQNVNIDPECMIDPGFHWAVDEEQELIKLLKQLLGK